MAKEPSTTRKHGIELDLMWAVLATHPFIRVEAVRMMMKAPQMLMREAVFEIMEKLLEHDQLLAIKLVTKYAKSDYDAST